MSADKSGFVPPKQMPPASRPVDAQPIISTWPIAEGSFESMADALAFELCERDGNDDPHHLIWEGSPPEPWGEVWQRYIPDAQQILSSAIAREQEWQLMHDTMMSVIAPAAAGSSGEPVSDDAEHAAFYRWMRDNPESPHHPYHDGGKWVIPHESSGAGGSGGGIGSTSFETLDAAIRAAIARAEASK